LLSGWSFTRQVTVEDHAVEVLGVEPAQDRGGVAFELGHAVGRLGLGDEEQGFVGEDHPIGFEILQAITIGAGEALVVADAAAGFADAGVDRGDGGGDGAVGYRSGDQRVGLVEPPQPVEGRQALLCCCQHLVRTIEPVDGAVGKLL